MSDPNEGSSSYHQAYGDQLARAIRAEVEIERLRDLAQFRYEQAGEYLHERDAARAETERLLGRLRSRDFAEAVELERAARGAGDDEYSVSAMQDSIRKVLGDA